jgi:hypothetical protein
MRTIHISNRERILRVENGNIYGKLFLSGQSHKNIEQQASSQFEGKKGTVKDEVVISETSLKRNRGIKDEAVTAESFLERNRKYMEKQKISLFETKESAYAAAQKVSEYIWDPLSRKITVLETEPVFLRKLPTIITDEEFEAIRKSEKIKFLEMIDTFDICSRGGWNITYDISSILFKNGLDNFGLIFSFSNSDKPNADFYSQQLNRMMDIDFMGLYEECELSGEDFYAKVKETIDKTFNGIDFDMNVIYHAPDFINNYNYADFNDFYSKLKAVVEKSFDDLNKVLKEREMSNLDELKRTFNVKSTQANFAISNAHSIAMFEYIQKNIYDMLYDVAVDWWEHPKTIRSPKVF